MNIGKVWARKGRRQVASRRGYDRTHITAMVGVSAAEKTLPLALLSTKITVSGRLFLKGACPVFIKAIQDDSKKDNRKAASSSDTRVQDNRKNKKHTKGGWSDAATI